MKLGQKVMLSRHALRAVRALLRTVFRPKLQRSFRQSLKLSGLLMGYVVFATISIYLLSRSSIASITWTLFLFKAVQVASGLKITYFGIRYGFDLRTSTTPPNFLGSTLGPELDDKHTPHSRPFLFVCSDKELSLKMLSFQIFKLMTSKTFHLPANTTQQFL